MLKRLYYILKQRVYVYNNRNKPCQGKVYMFHDISDVNDTYSIDKSSFNDLINYFVTSKRIVDVDKLKNELSCDNVVLTFDDAYASVYYEAYPLLRELNVPYYVFVCGEYLNKENYLNEEMIKEMISNSKCIVGSHNMKHELSRFMNDSDFDNSLKESKELLEEKFDIEVDSFAFPYGSIYACSNENIDNAKKRYGKVFMTYNLPYNKEYGNIIPRININQTNYRGEMR